jgi:hypothetical protein
VQVPPERLAPWVNLSRVDGLEHVRDAWHLILEAVRPDDGPVKPRDSLTAQGAGCRSPDRQAVKPASAPPC